MAAPTPRGDARRPLEAQIAPEQLASVVARATDGGGELGAWRVEPIDYPLINPIAGGVYRVRAESGAWSVVLKIARPPAGGMTPRGPAPPGWAEEPAHWNYWRREALLYASGLLGGVPGRLSAPRCFGVELRPDAEAWLWLEELGDNGGAWPPARLATAARHLGQFNGAFLSGRAIPDQPWLAAGWLRSWTDDVWGSLEPLIETPSAWEHPLIRRAFPAPVADRIAALWRERERFLDALDELPTTFAHRDAHPKNLFVRDAGGGSRTVAIDWTQAGPGPVGQDVGQMLVPSLLFSLVEAGEAAALERVLLDSYERGLADAGWSAAAGVVRLGYAASAALHWCFAGAFALRWAANPELLAAMERQFGRPIADVIARRAAVTYHLLDLADEARATLGL